VVVDYSPCGRTAEGAGVGVRWARLGICIRWDGVWGDGLVNLGRRGLDGWVCSPVDQGLGYLRARYSVRDFPGVFYRWWG